MLQCGVLISDAAKMHDDDEALTCVIRELTSKNMTMHASWTRHLLLLKREKVLLPLLVNSEGLLSRECLLLALLPLSWRGSVF